MVTHLDHRKSIDQPDKVPNRMYVCIYGHHIKQSMDQPGKVANPARGQLNRENEHSPVPVRA